MAIQRILCCCASGVGSSLLMRMNVEQALKAMGKSEITVRHSSLENASAESADLFIVGGDLEKFTEKLPRVIVLSNIMSMPELTEKLTKAFHE